MLVCPSPSLQPLPPHPLPTPSRLEARASASPTVPPLTGGHVSWVAATQRTSPPPRVRNYRPGTQWAMSVSEMVQRAPRQIAAMTCILEQDPSSAPTPSLPPGSPSLPSLNAPPTTQSTTSTTYLRPERHEAISLPQSFVVCFVETKRDGDRESEREKEITRVREGGMMQRKREQCKSERGRKFDRCSVVTASFYAPSLPLPRPSQSVPHQPSR
eukprot:3554438-Rhodomonas_salina.2